MSSGWKAAEEGRQGDGRDNKGPQYDKQKREHNSEKIEEGKQEGQERKEKERQVRRQGTSGGVHLQASLEQDK